MSSCEILLFLFSAADDDNIIPQFFDNDFVYQLQRSGLNIHPPAVSSWADIPVAADKDKNKSEKDALAKTAADNDNNDRKEKVQKSVSWSDCGTSMDDNSLPDNDNVVDNRMITEGNESLSLNSLDDRGIRRQLSREASRNKDKEMASDLISPRAPVLSTQVLDNIDIGELYI